MGEYNTKYDNQIFNTIRENKVSEAGGFTLGGTRKIPLPEAPEIGYKDIRGNVAQTPEEIATLLKDFRNPKVEYLHIVYVKNGKIIAHNALTNDVVNGARLSEKEIFYKIGESLRKNMTCFISTTSPMPRVI